MKIRTSYVSNSSSSSFLVPYDASIKHGVQCVKLSNEIVKCFQEHFVDFDGKKVDFSSSENWWLTELLSDCTPQYARVVDYEIKPITYLNGDNAPYGWYDEDGEKRYIVYHGGDRCNDFYVAVGDLIGEQQSGQIPDALQVKSAMESIIASKMLNKTQKLNAISLYLKNL